MVDNAKKRAHTDVTTEGHYDDVSKKNKCDNRDKDEVMFPCEGIHVMDPAVVASGFRILCTVKKPLTRADTFSLLSGVAARFYRGPSPCSASASSSGSVSSHGQREQTITMNASSYTHRTNYSLEGLELVTCLSFVGYATTAETVARAFLANARACGIVDETNTYKLMAKPLCGKQDVQTFQDQVERTQAMTCSFSNTNTRMSAKRYECECIPPFRCSEKKVFIVDAEEGHDDKQEEEDIEVAEQRMDPLILSFLTSRFQVPPPPPPPPRMMSADNPDKKKEKGNMHPALLRIANHPDASAREKVMLMVEESEKMMMPCPSSAKVKRWLEYVSRLPLDKFSPPLLEPSVSASTADTQQVPNGTQGTDGAQILQRSRKILDSVVHGMSSAKTAVVEVAAKLMIAPQAPLRALMLEGPPGCGKTTFVTRALGGALQRPVRVINVGGSKDSTSLLGYNYTYESSRPGRIVEEIMSTQVSDPVLVFDEVDKISDTPAGREISHVLMCLVDPVQNKAFTDSYLSGIPLDLSRVFVVFTCNDVNAVDPVLLDRVRLISIGDMSETEKCSTTRDFVFPRVAQEMGMLRDNVSLLPESEEERDRISKMVVHSCCSSSSSSSFSSSTDGGGMRGVEKTVERVLMNSAIRGIVEGGHSSFVGTCGGGNGEKERKESLVSVEDVEKTLKLMAEEKMQAQQAKKDFQFEACVRQSMYT